MKQKQPILHLKRHMPWDELCAALKILRKNPEFRAALKQFIKETTS